MRSQDLLRACSALVCCQEKVLVARGAPVAVSFSSLSRGEHSRRCSDTSKQLTWRFGGESYQDRRKVMQRKCPRTDSQSTQAFKRSGGCAGCDRCDRREASTRSRCRRLTSQGDVQTSNPARISDQSGRFDLVLVPRDKSRATDVRVGLVDERW